MSRMKYDRPRCFGWSQSVRASSSPQCALWALVVHTLCPLTTHGLPRISARVTAPATSEPLPGSLNNWHQMSSPVKMRSRNFSFCQSVPCARMVAAAKVRMPTLATPITPIRLNSSSTTGTRPTGRSRPYQRDGQCGTPHLDSASLRRHATSPRSGFQFASSQARTSARTVSSLTSVMSLPSGWPVLQHQFAVIVGVAQQHLGAFRPLEPEMRVVVPSETDAAVDLHGVNGGLHIRITCTSLGEMRVGHRVVVPVVQ